MTLHVYEYSIHTAASPERIWDALTRNEDIAQYWSGEWRMESDWATQSPLRFQTGDGAPRSQGRIIASARPERLAYTWPNPPREHGDLPPEELDWRVTETGPGVAELSLTHSNLTKENHRGVSGGWPAVPSSLKSLPETGRPLTFHD